MGQPIDLGVILTSPPEGSPPEVIATLALTCEQVSLSDQIGVLADPLTPQEREDLRWYLEEYPIWPYAGSPYFFGENIR